MKTISRDHHFESGLTLIRQGRKYFYLYHEHSNNPVRVQRTDQLDIDFYTENWEAFEQAEAEYYGGVR
jgi:predicted house-cleaning NTP pyrophosphatase (Maf/HAM1 superfamily)